MNTKFREGPKFTYSSASLFAYDAKQYCEKSHGNLASIKNFYDFDAMDTHSSKKCLLGGTDEAIENEWVWPDGSPVPGKSLKQCRDLTTEEKYANTVCQAWNNEKPGGGKDNNCLAKYKSQWWGARCDKKYPFWCENQATKLDKSIQRTYALKTKSFSQLDFWWTADFKDGHADCSSRKNTPGFFVSWKTMNASQEIIEPKNEITDKFYLMANSRDKKFMGYLRKITSFVVKAKEQHWNNSQIWDIIVEQKVDLIRRNVMVCEFGYAQSSILSKIISPLFTQLSENSNSSNKIYDLTKGDYIFTLEIFSYLIFCETEANQVFSFYNNLLRVDSAMSILQATVNNLKSKQIKEENKAALKEIYLKLDEIIDLKSGNILRALSNTETIKRLEKSENVFFTRKRKSNNRMGKINNLSCTYVFIILFRWSLS